ncbi:MAG: hydrogenase 2 operon protein HybA [Gammaproteobacteria bacterium]|nr:MAG: hydrogenase 2 operon protein HybA [Gammaproteobacteria bacterium]
MKRRDFLKMAGSGAIIATSAGEVSARGNRPVSEEAVGMLFDATRCIGCRACVVRCKELNGMPPVTSEGAGMWDEAQELDARTLNIIKAYKGEDTQGQPEFSFIKRNCMHCVDPGCVSACPVSAMTKDPKTGIVDHHPDICMGCRNCVVACPYNIPKYEYNDAFGQIQKCRLCNQKGLERIDQGLLPGCAEVCPTGANIYGKRKDLLEEAKRRLSLKPGDEYHYPLNHLDSPFTAPAKVGEYQTHIFGEKEGGGTQVLLLAGVPFEKLGLPDLPERSYASMSETVQHTIYKGMFAPMTLLAGLLYVARRNTQDKTPDELD